MTRGKLLALTPTGGYEGFNTSVHRINAFKELGYDVEVIDSAINLSGFSGFWYRLFNYLFRLGLPLKVPDIGANAERLQKSCSNESWDIVWLEKGMTITAEVIQTIRKFCPGARIVGFSPDDMYARHNQTQQFLGALAEYDSFVTTKTYNVKELQELGCPRVLFMPNGYDPIAFHPIETRNGDFERFGGSVGFIGSFEEERAESMLFLAKHEISVRVWGNGWHKLKKHHPNLMVEERPLYGQDYARACASFSINLCFLRKVNRDLQTTRSVEIPACGGFMLAERTVEHLNLFREGVEADFFRDDTELLVKCQLYLDNYLLRKKIALAGYHRCVSGGYSNKSRLATIIGKL